MPVFLKEPVHGDCHSGPQSVGLLKSPLRCLPWLSRGEGLAKCHSTTKASTCTIGEPVVVACLPHLTAAGTTASLKCCWSKACRAFGIKLHWTRQENAATVMEREHVIAYGCAVNRLVVHIKAVIILFYHFRVDMLWFKKPDVVWLASISEHTLYSDLQACRESALRCICSNCHRLLSAEWKIVVWSLTPGVSVSRQEQHY